MFKLIKKILLKVKKPQEKVAHINLSGVIGKDSRFEKGLNFDNILPLLENAKKLDGLKALAVSINSPGGSPVQSELIYKAIREFGAEKNVPILTFAQDVAASGGYWLLLSGDEIYAHNSSIIGSIGVIFSGFGFVDLIKKIGVERRVYSEGKNKAVLDPFLDEKQENIDILKDAQRDIFNSFKEFVFDRRKDKLKDFDDKILQENDDFLTDNIFTGAFWSGKKAKNLGLVDEIADLRGKIKEKFGKNVKIVNVENKKGFLKSLFSAKQENLVKQISGQIEEKISFSRFGL